jgi:hypothetical protein
MDDNVLPHLAAVLRDAGQKHRNRTADIATGEADPEAIAAVLGTSLEEVVRRRGATDPNGRFRFQGVEMRRDDVHTGARRFSPASLGRSPHHRSIWMLRQLPICTESWEPLVRSCTCGAVQNWTMVRLVHLCDACGQPLAEQEVGSVPEEDRPALALYADLLSPDSGMRRTAMEKLAPGLAGLAPGHAVDLALALTPLVERGIDRSPRSPRIWRDRPLLLASALAEAVGLLRDWPGSLIAAIGRNVDPRDAMPRSSALLRIGRLLEGAGRGGQPEPVRRAVAEAADTLRVPGAGSAVAIDYHEAERLSSRNRMVLLRARRSGVLRTSFILRRGELLPVLDRKEIEGLSADTIGAAVAGRLTAIPRYGILQLARLSLLRWIDHPFVVGRDGVQIVKTSLEELAARLAAGADDLPDSKTMPLPILLRSVGGREKPIGPVFHALAEGRLPYAFDAGPAPLLRRIRVVPDGTDWNGCPVDRFGPNPHPALLGDLVQEDARDILNLHARDASVLSPHVHRRSRCTRFFRRVDVLSLAAKHATCGELAARSGLNNRAVVARLDAARVPHLGPLGWRREEALACFA